MKKFSKALTSTVVLMMLLQSVGMSGVMAVASEISPDTAQADSIAPTAAVPAIEEVPAPDPVSVKTEVLAPVAAEVLSAEVSDAAAVETPAFTQESPVLEPALAEDAEDNLVNGVEIITSLDSDWKIDGDTAVTKDSAKLGVKYEFPGNENVSVTFTKLPKDEGELSPLKIEQIASENINLPEGVSPATDFAYDITTNMQNGDFEYNLTLPKAEDSGAEVKYIEKSAEDVVSADVKDNELKNVDETKVKAQKDSVAVSELDHFTVFLLVTNQTAASNSVSNPNNGWISDDQRATFDSSNDWAEYGFSDLGVPADSTIDGIEVSVEGRQTFSRDFTVALWNTSGSNPDAYTATQTAVMSTASSDTTVTVGGSTNKWGKTWTVADFADATFKIKVGATSSFGDALLDAVQVKVHYTLASATGTLVINKTVLNDNSGASIASDFSFSVNGGAAVPFEADGSNAQTVSAGTYSITEPAVSGYTATFGNSLNANADCTNLAVAAGGTVTCTITNDDNAPAYVPVVGNVIANPSFETGTGNNATNWSTNNYDTTATFSIAGGAHSGNRAAKVEVTSSSGGDAKWLFNSVPVTAGQYYTFTEWYKASVPTEINIFYTGGATEYAFLVNLPAASTWTEFHASFLVPSGVTAVSVGHLLGSVGTLTTDDYSLVLGTVPVFSEGGMVSLTFDDGLKSFYNNGVPVLNAAGYKATAYINSAPVQAGSWPDYMNSTEVISLYNQGYDIGGHSSTHVPAYPNTGLTEPGVDLTAEINDNRTYLQGLGLGAVDNFAYPFGYSNAAVIAQVQAAGYLGARSVEAGYNFTDADRYTLRAMEVDGNTTAANVKAWVDEAKTQKAWLILLFHDVKNGDCANAAGSYCTNAATLQEIVNYLAAQHMTVPTVSQGLAVMGGGAIPDTIAPILAESTPVTVLTNNPTPQYTFSSSEAGTITYGGSCASAQTAAVAGFNTITLNTLSSGVHSDCTVRVKDAANNTSPALAISAFTLDTAAPIVTIASYNTAPTNADILVSAVTNEGTLNATEHLFTANGTFDFVATDAAGNVTTQVVTITNIDKDAPVITVDDYITTPTNQDILVNASTGMGTLNADSHLFTENGSFDFVATDEAMNVTTKTVTITNIDKNAPVINVLGENPVSLTAGDSYADAGATASDNTDSSIVVQSTGSVDTAVAGEYAITYLAADTAGNIVSAMRIIRVNAKTIDTSVQSLPYSIKKNAKRKITFTFHDLSLTKKKYVNLRLNGRKVVVSRVWRSGKDSLVTVNLKYGKWAVGSYNLAMNWKNQIKVPYLTNKGKTKYRKGWESGTVSSDNILSII